MGIGLQVGMWERIWESRFQGTAHPKSLDFRWRFGLKIATTPQINPNSDGACNLDGFLHYLHITNPPHSGLSV
jgi:hypothetical protein